MATHARRRACNVHASARLGSAAPRSASFVKCRMTLLDPGWVIGVFLMCWLMLPHLAKLWIARIVKVSCQHLRLFRLHRVFDSLNSAAQALCSSSNPKMPWRSITASRYIIKEQGCSLVGVRIFNG